MSKLSCLGYGDMRWSKGLAPPVNQGIRRMLMVIFAPRPLYLQERAPLPMEKEVGRDGCLLQEMYGTRIHHVDKTQEF